MATFKKKAKTFDCVRVQAIDQIALNKTLYFYLELEKI
jgi:hypothetical protein